MALYLFKVYVSPNRAVDLIIILSDDRINNRAVTPLITKITEEWVMINFRVFKENAAFLQTVG